MWHRFLCLFSILVGLAFILPVLLGGWILRQPVCSCFTQKAGSTGVLKQNGLGELNFSIPQSLSSGLHHQVLSLNEDAKQKSLAHHIRLHKGRSLRFPVSAECDNVCIVANPLSPVSSLELCPKTRGKV